MRMRTVAVLVSITLLLAAGFVADRLKEAEDALIGRRYAEAAALLQLALADEPIEGHDRILLLLARAQFLAGEVDAAIASCERLGRDHPDSELVDRAALQQAEALARAGRHREAAAVYREQVERLTGPERKEAVAETYLGLAERVLNGERNDPLAALRFYDLALGLGLGEAKARAIELLAAEAAMRAAAYPEVIERLTGLLDELTPADGKLRAMLLLGRAWLECGDPSRARRVFRDLIALERDAEEAGEAAFEIARSYGAPSPGAARLDHAIAAIRALAAQHPKHPQARLADWLIAQCYLSAQRSDDALAALSAFIDSAADAAIPELASARAAVGFVLFGQGRIDEAIAAWRAYLAAHPSHADWERVQRGIVDAELARADRALEAEHWDEARALYEDFVQQHPLDSRSAEILLRIAESLATQDRAEDARVAFERVVRKYPGRDESSRAQFRIAELHETADFDYRRALEAYRAVTWGSWQPRARERIAALERRSLHVHTPRSYRSGETASFEVRSRNLPALRVRVHRLDLETWFRATHLPGSVELLDIEVIEPDATFHSPVPDYTPYRETVRPVELGFDEPGCYVVKVDGEDLEATTMVLITDLGMIVKSSRHELLVFTQDLKSERVQAGARVVVSDGTRIVSEGTTDAGGVFRWRDAALQEIAELRVFAVDASGSGAGTLDLGGLGYHVGLRPKAYLFSDRPAYQPGEVAHFKGIVRDVEQARYVLPPPDAELRFVVRSPSGLTLLERDVELSPFGSFAAELPLPPAAELGTWRIELTRGSVAATRTVASFEVARFELPRLLLTIEPAQPVVFRGEAIAGRALLRHFHGDPAVGEDVQVELRRRDGSKETMTGRSDAEGAVDFSFDSSAFAEEAIATLVARVADEGIEAQLAVPIVTAEFVPELSTLRDLQIAGQSFDVSVTIRDRSGRSLAKAGEVVLARRSTRRGVVTEVEVARIPFRTTTAAGRATVAMLAPEGGEHVLRVIARDRFGQVLTAERTITVSGGDDAIKLRLTSDRQSHRVGDLLRVTVLNRAGEHLALLTSQADGILESRAIVVPAGASELELQLDGAHAPNFALALAMIDGTALHTAEREFFVARDLQLELRPKRTQVEPGADLEVEVRARDAAGRPVVAELSLALVDRALFERFADQSPAIGEYFFGAQRESTFRTQSSCGWSYDAPSRPVHEALAEEERRAAQRAATIEPDRLAPGDGAVPREREVVTAEVAPGSAAPGGYDGAAPSAGRPIVGEYAARKALGEAERSDDATSARRAGYRDQLAAIAELGTGEARRVYAPDGVWLSAVTTDREGRATLTIPAPTTSGAWRLTARAVTAATDVGEARIELTTSSDLIAALSAPAVLVAGDRTVARGSLHNRTAEELPIDLEVVSGAQRRRSEVTAPARGDHDFDLPLTAVVAGPLPIAIAARTADGHRAAAERSIDVQPFGVELRDGRSGELTQSARFVLSLPRDRELSDLALDLEIVPGSLRGLIAAALDDPYLPGNCRRPTRTCFATVQRGLAALALLDAIDDRGQPARADRAALEAAVSAAVTATIAVQRSDGSIPWIGGGEGDLRTTAAALRLLGGAGRRGSIAARGAAERAGDWLIDRLRGVRDEDRIDAERALAVVGRGRFEALNAVHRRRASLDLDALGRLALAWRALDRSELADEIDAVAATKWQLPAAATAADLVAVALALRSRISASPADPRVRQGLDWLDSQRRGASWPTPEATAESIATFAAAGGASLAAAAEGELIVSVNGAEIERIDLHSLAGRLAPSVPASALRPQDNVVALQLVGRGSLRYSAVLRGFASGFEPGDRNAELIAIRRDYLAAPLRIDGRVVAPGFGVVSGRHSSFRNLVTELPVGATARVETSFILRGAVEQGFGSPLIVEEPIPAGCTVPRDSIQGSFAHVELLPDRIVCYYRDAARGDWLRYELLGRFEGEYRALPTIVRGVERPDRIAYGPPSGLKVIARDARSVDEFRATPDELYALGKAAFAAGDFAAAGGHFDALTADFTLRDEVFTDVARMMLSVAIYRDDARATVRWFEELKDRDPRFVVSFTSIRAVAAAYLELGEFESALLVYRATAESSFLEDAKVADTLQELGETKAAFAHLRRLVDTYPGLNVVRQSLYGIGQRLAMIAAAMPLGARIDERVGSARELRAQAITTLRDFLLQFPEDPLAEEATFAWATTAIEAGDLEQALAVAEAALARAPQSSLEDEFLYTAGYARFALGRPAAALAALRRVASEDFPQAGGGSGPSENRQHAIYLEAQIHHALGETREALIDYDRVAADFADAVEAARWFRREELILPEVETITSTAPQRLTITTRNLDEVAIEVYRVDLMRLYLLDGSLDDIRGVRLHGIAPLHATTVEIRGAVEHARVDTALDLPIADDGAYLVVARAGEQLASGLLLRTDLVIDAEENCDLGRVRVHVRRSGEWVGHAQVKVVGSGFGRIRSGETDLRGIFDASDLVGRATVIVKLDGAYAFHRGSGLHQPARMPAPLAVPAVQEAAPPAAGQRFDVWSNNMLLNDQNRRRQGSWLEQNVLKVEQKGVDVFRTK